MLTHANEASHPGDTWIGHPGVPASTVARGKAENPSIGFERRCNLTQTASHGMTGLTKKKTGISNPNTNSIPRYDWSASVLPDSNSAKALPDSRSAGDPLKYLVTHEYNCPFLQGMSLETQRPHMNQAPIAEYTIGT